MKEIKFQKEKNLTSLLKRFLFFLATLQKHGIWQLLSNGLKNV